MMSIVDELKERIDIVEFISRYVKLKKSGSNYFGLCPFHVEKTPSFSVNPEKGFFHCFGCGESGDVIKFYMKIENLEFKEAVRELAEQYGIEIHRFKEQHSILFDIHTYINKLFRNELHKHLEATNYLKQRKIPPEAIDRFGIGFGRSTEILIRKMTSEFPYKELIKSGLFVEGRYGLHMRFDNRITFPIKDLKGRIVGFGGRTISGGGKPKYINSPETPIFSKKKILYGLYEAKDSARKNGAFILTEGYFDCIRLHISGLNNAVATLGTALSVYHTTTLGRYTEKIYLNYDADEAGFKAMKRSAPVVLSSPIKAFVVTLDRDEDPDSFIAKHGVQHYIEKLNSAVPYFDYIIGFLRDRYELNDPVEKARAIEELKDIVHSIREPVIRSGYISKVARILNISEGMLSMKQDTSHHIPKGLNKAKALLGFLSVEPTLVSWIENPDGFEKHFSGVELDLYRAIKNCYKNNTSINHILDKLPKEVSNLYYEVSLSEYILSVNEKSMIREIFKYLIRELERENILKELKELKKRIEQGEPLTKEYSTALRKLTEL